ncbi:MAG: GAP family protein [Nocardioides sp.]|nr:GAP family protein [Nocardioides sp.]
MLALLAVVAPLGLSAAVSPVMLSEQVVVVGGPRGRRLGTLYAVGAVSVLVVVVVVVSVVGRTLRLPTAPHLDAGADIVLGVALLGVAWLVHRHRARGPRDERPHRAMTPPVALGFGVVSMATNVTTLAIVVVAVKEVTASGDPVLDRAPALALLVVLASAPAWLPVLVTLLPGSAGRVLVAVNDLVSRHGRQVIVVLLVALGAFLVVRGTVHLAEAGTTDQLDPSAAVGRIFPAATHRK